MSPALGMAQMRELLIPSLDEGPFTYALVLLAYIRLAYGQVEGFYSFTLLLVIHIVLFIDAASNFPSLENWAWVRLALGPVLSKWFRRLSMPTQP